jgi:hypothetical protein
MALGHGCWGFFRNFFVYSDRRRKRGIPVKFYCNQVEQAYIKACAKKAGKTVADYMRRGAMQGFEGKDKSLSSKVLAFQGQLAHVCGLLEVIARKRLDGDELNALERAQLNEIRQSLQETFEQIKQHLS